MEQVADGLSDTITFSCEILPINDSPLDFTLISPSEGEIITVHEGFPDTTISFNWNESTDADNDGVCDSIDDCVGEDLGCGCNEPAPFTSMNGNPYLECHHIQQVSKGGPDHPLNVIALCPNCHKRTEHSSDKKSKKDKTIKKYTG